jgi:regulatory protein
MGVTRSRASDSGPADPTSVRRTALALLARRDYATAELRAALEKRGCEASTAQAVIAELIAERALDVVRFAESYAASRVGRGQGPVRIAAELRALGLAAELIEQVVASAADWGGLARQVRQRRFGAAAPQGWAEKARQARFLQYRGFSSDHIRSALGPDFDPDE